MPCYGGSMHAKCALSLISLYHRCLVSGVKVYMQTTLNDSLITRARNLLVDAFLKSDATHLLFIDSDIEFDSEDLLKMITSDVDLIGGLYAKKDIDWDNIERCVKRGCEAKDLPFNATTSVIVRTAEDTAIDLQRPISVKWVGTGLMLAKRVVFERLRDAYPGETYDQQGIKDIYCFFDGALARDYLAEDGRRANQYLSEDWYFCERWNRIGGQVFAAPWTKTTHYGNFGFHANAERYLDKPAMLNIR
jgi:hypothetical protein